MLQLVRLVVLFEDLKLEAGGLHLPEGTGVDELSKHFRQIYFVRRAFATIAEMRQAFHKLNMLPAFKSKVGLLNAERKREWDAALKFFEATDSGHINIQRNAVGGHFHDKTARFVVEQGANDDDGSVGVMEMRISDSRTSRYVFRFAEDLANNAMFVGQGETDPREYLAASFALLTEAVGHASKATQALADLYFVPVFRG